MINEVFYPAAALALTGGPSQPEVEGFAPVEASNMVNLFTGDFSYNIPLFEIGGYPMNISYDAGITMDQEASWVGLGWNLNPGSITREMRGLPDDFKEDTIVKEYNISPDETVGVKAGLGFELFGWGNVGLGLGYYYNNYRGYGVEGSVSPGVSIANWGGEGNLPALGAGLDLSFDSQQGANLGISVNYGLTEKNDKNTKATLSLGVGGYNSRAGLKELTIQGSLSLQTAKKENKPTDSSVTTKDGPDTEAAIPSSISRTASGHFTFGDRTYTPTPQLKFTNTSFTFFGSIGLELFGGDGNINATAYQMNQSLEQQSYSYPAYGYLNTDKGKGNDHNLLDYNRDRQGAFHENMPVLPMGQGTFDLFSISGQGTGGQFRAMRNDAGIFQQAASSNSNVSLSGGIQVSTLQTFKIGVDIQRGVFNATSEPWTEENQMNEKSLFTSKEYNSTYENCFFKTSEDIGLRDEDFYAQLAQDYTIRTALGKDAGISHPNKDKALNAFVKEESQAFKGLKGVNSSIRRNERVPRNRVISYLDNMDASKQGLLGPILNYPMDTLVYTKCMGGIPEVSGEIDTLYRTSKKAHHMSEITILEPDGRRYFYGIPAYNLMQKEVSFAIEKNGADPVEATYNPGTDNSRNNYEGVDHFYEAQITPPYAHSFLLTGIVSPDYVDMTGNGISEDDLGSAVRINYTKLNYDYQWRTPYGQNKARYSEGLNSLGNDQRASYVYGKKEIWYTHSMESNTDIALFYLTDRKDGLPVLDENGGRDTSKHLKKLTEIRIFNKADLIEHGEDAIPIKTIHFAYNYALCPGIENNDSLPLGKLTLKEIYTTYADNKARFNYYKFDYNEGNGSYNPDYANDLYDRWSNYKLFESPLPNKLFPYASQNAANADEAARVWNLATITLPSGGTIGISYESDDYAYVQDKRAGQMLPILGFGSGVDPADPFDSNKLYNEDNVSSDWDEPNLYIYVANPEGYSIEEIRERYFTDVKELYFNINVTLRGDNREQVQGYAEIEDIVAIPDGSDTRFAIKLKGILNGMNPITKAGLQFLRLNLPRLAYSATTSDPGPSDDLLEELVEFAVGSGVEIARTLDGFDDYSRKLGYARTVNLSKSWIRLSNPTFKKYGGGSRVKSVKINDKWGTMTPNSHTNKEYETLYTYTTTIKINGEDQEISSGVASYEPILGNEENLMRNPMTYMDKVPLGIDNFYYVETPVGESLFPSPLVGYSEVKVSKAESTYSKVGYTVTKYYTAKDFPVIVDYTDLQKVPQNGNPILNFLKLNASHSLTASQGIKVEVNDMHGKPSEEHIYDATGSLLSSTLYTYNVDNELNLVKHLKNEVLVADKDGVIETATLGMDVEVWQDAQHDKSSFNSFANKLGVDAFVIATIPVVIPTMFPSVVSDNRSFRYISTTKFIKRTGLLRKITKMENGSTITTENLVYDKYTGNVIITKTQNEFNEPIFQTVYPAHWAYDGMGLAYKNIGTEFKDVTITAGVPTIDGSTDIFDAILTEGDELIGYKGPFAYKQRLYVIKTLGKFRIVDNAGAQAPVFTYSLLKIKRSGRRNLASTPIAAYTTLASPVNGSTIKIDSVINASATVFSQNWQAKQSLFSGACNDASGNLSVLDTLLQILTMRDTFWDTQSSENIHLSNMSVTLTGNPKYYVIAGSPGQKNWFFEAVLGNCLLQFSNNGKFFYLEDLVAVGDNLIYNGDTLSINYVCDCRTQPGCVVYSPLDSPDFRRVNPFFLNMAGAWRPYKTYAYHTNRTPVSIAQMSSNRLDGRLTQFSNFWYFGSESGFLLDNSNADSNWVAAQEIISYDQRGNDIQSKDALNIHSAAQLGYNWNLVTAITENSELNDMGYDGFEDYRYLNNCNNNVSCDEDDPNTTHFSFSNGTGVLNKIKDTKAHTGLYSIELNSDSVAFDRVIKSNTNGYDRLNVDPDSFYAVGPDGNIPIFNPSPGDYLVSAWVYKADTTANPYLVVKVGSTAYNFLPSGPDIEGWKRIFGKVTISDSDNTTVTVRLRSGTGVAYFDDVRINPYDGNMKSYAYNRFTLRLMAELDENNYATFYEYNDAGQLVRVKKETERGIMTLKENREYLKSLDQ